MICNKCRTNEVTNKRRRYCNSCSAKRKDRLGDSYTSRNLILKKLGFENYSDYLKSDLWKSIRKKVYSQKGDQCCLCENKATELHHHRYAKDDLTGKRTKNIKPICHECHEKIEFENGTKNSVMKVKQKFNQLKKN